MTDEKPPIEKQKAYLLMIIVYFLSSAMTLLLPEVNSITKDPIGTIFAVLSGLFVWTINLPLMLALSLFGLGSFIFDAFVHAGQYLDVIMLKGVSYTVEKKLVELGVYSGILSAHVGLWKLTRRYQIPYANHRQFILTLFLLAAVGFMGVRYMDYAWSGFQL